MGKYLEFSDFSIYHDPDILRSCEILIKKKFFKNYKKMFISKRNIEMYLEHFFCEFSGRGWEPSS